MVMLRSISTTTGNGISLYYIIILINIVNQFYFVLERGIPSW